MIGKKAKILADEHARGLLRYAASRRHPIRDRVLVLLSLKAGLRAGEIAALTWPMVLDPSGQICPAIELRDHAAKKGSGRVIPVHPNLKLALARLRQQSTESGPVIRSERGDAMTPVSVCNWFAAAYSKLGLKGCSSHSGRRTFITKAARLLPKSGGSLRDIQLLAGHRSIQTTQGYIDGDSDAQRRLVGLL